MAIMNLKITEADILKIRQALLSIVDVFERALGMERTAEIRKEYKERKTNLELQELDRVFSGKE